MEAPPAQALSLKRPKRLCMRCGEAPKLKGRYLCKTCVVKRCARCGGTAQMTRWGRMCMPCGSKQRREGRQCHTWTQQEDVILQEAYTTHYAKKALLVVSKRLPHISREMAKHRATVLGLSKARKKNPPWSEEELQILERCAYQTPTLIARALRKAGFERTASGVNIQLKRRKLDRKGDWMGIGDVAELLGVDRSTVGRWMDQGWLRSIHTGKIQGGGEVRLVEPGALRTFLLQHHHAVRLSAVEKAGATAWLFDLLSDGSSLLRADQSPEGSDIEAPEPLHSGREHKDLLRDFLEEASSCLARARGTLSPTAHARRASLSSAGLQEAFSSRPTFRSLIALADALGMRWRLSLEEYTQPDQAIRKLSK